MVTESRAGYDALGVVVAPGTVSYVTTGGEAAPPPCPFACPGRLSDRLWLLAQGRFPMAPTPSCKWRTPNRSPSERMGPRGLGFWRGPPRGRTSAMWYAKSAHCTVTRVSDCSVLGFRCWKEPPSCSHPPCSTVYTVLSPENSTLFNLLWNSLAFAHCLNVSCTC